MVATFTEKIETGRETEPSAWRDLFSGALAGEAAGLVMAVVMMLVFAFALGKSPLFPVQVIGSFVFGDRAIEGFNSSAIVTGLLLHQLGPSLFWGLALGWMTYAFETHRGMGLVMLGLFTGILSQIMDVNVILPAVYQGLHGHDIWAEQVPLFWSWMAHLAYGLGLVSYSWFYDRLEEYF